MMTISDRPDPSSPDTERGDRPSVAAFLVHGLRRAGVTHVFGVPGGPLLPLYEALAACPDIELVLAKHEEGAAFMAVGYAQVSGRLAVVCGTAGPGALHVLTGLASATADGVPVLALTGQVDSSAFGRGALQDSSGGNWSVDTVDAFRTAAKLSAMAASPAQIPRLLAHALRTAYAGLPGGVHLSVPADIMAAAMPSATMPTVARPAPAAVDQPALAALLHALGAARRGMVLAGQGAKLSNAGPALVRLAERLGWPVATTLKGKSVFPEDHPLAAGVFGFGGGPQTNQDVLAHDVDTLLVVGSSLGELATHGWDPRLVTGRTVCRMDIDPLREGSGFEADVHVTGDATTVLEALLTTAHQPHEPAPPPDRGPRPPAPAAHTLQQGHTILQASAVVAAMSTLLPADTLVFADNGNCLSWLGRHYLSRPPGRIHVSLNIGSMGYSAGAAIGGRLAAPDRTVVALTGDAAFAMGGMEIHTACELGLPVIWIVLNNSGNAMVHNLQQGLFGHTAGSMYRDPLDAAAIARALGARGTVARTLPEFEATLTHVLDSPGPALIDVRVDPEEIPWALTARITGLRSAFHRQDRPPGTIH